MIVAKIDLIAFIDIPKTCQLSKFQLKREVQLQKSGGMVPFKKNLRFMLNSTATKNAYAL